jgi:hypothetical protein
MRVTLMAGALMAVLVLPAWADQCPSSIAALDEHMRQHGSMLSAEQADRLKELRDEAEKAHAAGDHSAAMEAIRQAHEIMGM